MKIGLQIPKFTWPGGDAAIGSKLAEIGRTADQGGFASLWVMDHFFQLDPMLGAAEEPMLESYSALNFLAGITRRARLGALVSGVIYRNPAFLIKQVTTLDVLSGGRAYFGIGAGWYEREAKGYGFGFPPLSQRFERLEEALNIAHLMWSGQVETYNGLHYQVGESICSPMPVSQPHPPILIGGMGEHKTLFMVAKYADACNLFARAGLPVLKNKIEILKRHCDIAGRPFEEIELTTLDTVHLSTPTSPSTGPDPMNAAAVIAHCRELAGLGITHAIFNMPNVHEITPLEIFAKEIIPAVAEF